MPHINIEIKAHTTDPDRIRDFLITNHAEFRGTDHQIDTYFKVPTGRLKLREGNIENYLIFYHRPNQLGSKQSDVILYKTKPGSPIKQILTQSLGVLVVVDKKREIYFIDNVKFHIDQVTGLGSFMEIEAIDTNGDIGRDKLLEQCQHYMRALDVAEQDLITNSYSDMMVEKAYT